MLTRIFPRHSAALNGSPQAEAEGRQEPCWAPSLHQQRHVRRKTPKPQNPKNASLSSGRGHWGHRRTPLPSSTRRMGRRANLPRRRARSTLLHFAARRCCASAERWCRCPPWRPFWRAPREPRRLWAPREPRRLVIGADSKKSCYMEGAYTAAAGLLGRGRGLASPETHHPPHPSLAQIFQQCIPRAPSLDFRSGL